MRRSFLVVLASLAASLTLPALASAADFELFLDQGRLQLNGGAGETDVLALDEDSSNFSGELFADGAVAVPASDIALSGFRLPGGTRVSAEATENASGSYDEQSGELDLSVPVEMLFRPEGAPAGTGCRYSLELALNTETASPDGEFSGVRFTESGLFGAGSLVASWSELPPGEAVGAQPQCGATDAEFGSGPGAIQLGFPVGPRLETRPAPRAARVKQGGTATYRLTVRSIDTDQPADVRVCGQLEKGLSVVGGRCQTLANVGPNGKTAVVKIKAARNARPGNYDQLGLLANAAGFEGGASRIELRVARR